MSTAPDLFPPSSRPVAPGAGLVQFVVAQRPTVAWVLIALGLLFGVGSLFCVARLIRSPAAAAATSREKDADKADPDKPEVRPADPRQTEYILGAITGFMGAVAGLGLGGRTLGGLPDPDERGRRVDARMLILLAGGLFGLVLMAGGLGFLIYRSGLLFRWLDERTPPPNVWQPLAALLAFLVGAGLAFVAAQPARADERDDPGLRRLVYGTNTALGIVLVALALLAVNVVAGLKVPARLDTTENGLYTVALSEPTKEYLRNLSQPVTAYTTLAEYPTAQAADAGRLLAACHEAAPDKFTVRDLSPSLNTNEIAQLKSKYPQADLGRELGILLTTGPDDKQSAFLRYRDLSSDDRAGKVTFQGEAKLAQELLGMTEAKVRPVVYFTQGGGELSIAPGAEGQDAGRVAEQLRTVLDKSFCDVRPLRFGADTAAVPDDAAVVVVADPPQPLPGRVTDAVRKYMTLPRPGGPTAPKGKLIVLAGNHFAPDGKLTDTGLEPLLAELGGVRLGTTVVYHEPVAQYGPKTAVVIPNPELVRGRNPIALAFRSRAVPMDDIRLVYVPRKAPAGGDAGLTAEPLLFTYGRMTWQEPARAADPTREFETLMASRSQELYTRKKVTEGSLPVGAIVSEGTTARAVVVGAGDFFADETGRRFGGTNVQAELFGACVNWLRERPAVANIAAKTYGTYSPDPKMDAARSLLLPVGVTLLGVVGLGLGVWAFRRT